MQKDYRSPLRKTEVPRKTEHPVKKKPEVEVITRPPCNMAIGGGKPWKYQHNFNTGENISVVHKYKYKLPLTLCWTHAFVTRNKVYLLGGYDGKYFVNSIYYSDINPDGTIDKFIHHSDALPTDIGYSQIVVTKFKVYLLGGYDGRRYLDRILEADIGMDGTIGTFIESYIKLPIGLSDAQAIVTKNRVYLVGGRNNGMPVDTVYVANVYYDGSLSDFTLDDNILPSYHAYMQCILTKNKAYLLGGHDGRNFVNYIYEATISEEGTLGEFVKTVRELPCMITDAETFVTRHRAYILGGYNGKDWLDKIYSAIVSPDGSLGGFEEYRHILPIPLSLSQLVITKNRFYLLGGKVPDSSPSNNLFCNKTIDDIYTSSFSEGGGLNDYSIFYNGLYNDFTA